MLGATLKRRRGAMDRGGVVSDLRITSYSVPYPMPPVFTSIRSYDSYPSHPTKSIKPINPINPINPDDFQASARTYFRTAQWPLAPCHLFPPSNFWLCLYISLKPSTRTGCTYGVLRTLYKVLSTALQSTSVSGAVRLPALRAVLRRLIYDISDFVPDYGE